MSTLICSNCGTRNPADNEACRRCDVPLGDVMPTTGTAVSPIVADRWQIEGPLPGTDNPYLYYGRDLRTDGPVIIKRLSRAAARDRTVRGKFQKEAEILGALDHPNLVRLVEVIDDTQMPAMILQAQGQMTLAELLARRGRLPVGIALEFALHLLNALEYMHKNRVNHRRLMPTKLLVGQEPGEGYPKLTVVDFGLAHQEKVKTLDELEYGAGTLVGMRATDTITGESARPYQAPEQLHGESDLQSDLYSLGVIFFEMLTGEVPLSSSLTDEAETERSIKHEAPTSIRLLRPEVSAKLEAVVMEMLSKNPNRRFEDVTAVRSALVMAPEAKNEAMVAVPAGVFLQGSREDDPEARREEQPQREVDLDSYYIDRTPVTVADYKAFLDATGRKPVAEWSEHNDVESAPNHPVVFVTWQEAADYAEWAGKRLPTEAEWEKAARGTDGRTFPWGDDAPTGKRARYNAETTSDVGSRPFGTSPWGVHEMAGNAFEWVADWYERDYYRHAPSKNPRGPESGEKKCIRGGSFAHGEFALRCATRGRYAPGERRANHGFRCAWSLLER